MMKKILAVLFVLLGMASVTWAVPQYEADIIITNLPIEGHIIVINSQTNTFKTNVTVAASQISITNSIAQTATNVWLHYAAYRPPSNAVYVSQVASGIHLFAQAGDALSISTSNHFAKIINIKTNTVSTAFTVRMPITSEPTALSRTNIANWIIAAINSFASTALNGTVAPGNGISTNRVFVSAIGTNSTSLTAGTYTKIPYNFHQSPAGMTQFWSIASSRFSPPINGHYRVSGQVGLNAAPANAANAAVGLSTNDTSTVTEVVRLYLDYALVASNAVAYNGSIYLTTNSLLSVWVKFPQSNLTNLPNSATMPNKIAVALEYPE